MGFLFLDKAKGNVEINQRSLENEEFQEYFQPSLATGGRAKHPIPWVGIVGVLKNNSK